MMKLLLGLCCLTLSTLSTLAAADSSTAREDVQRIVAYWNSISQGAPVEAADAKAIERVEEQQLTGIAGSHRLYVLNRTGPIEDQREVVAVSPNGAVVNVSTRSGFNAMLVAEGTRTDRANDAEELARAFVRITNYGWKGWERFRLLESIDDIEFPPNSEEQRDQLIEVGVKGPSVAVTEDGYRVTAYSWNSARGVRGSIKRVEVEVTRGFAEVLRVEYSNVANEVGVYQGY